MAYFIFVAVNIKPIEFNKVFEFFRYYRILNCVIITQGHVMKASYNPFTRKPYIIDSSIKNLNDIFPDKLQDLHGYKYETTFEATQSPRLVLLDGKAHGPDVEFIKTVAKHQKGGVNFHVTKTFAQSFNDITRGLDILLNTHVFFKYAYDYNLVETYDTDGLCALVPLPGIKTYFDFITKPFDLWIWIFILLSMICCAITWRFLNGSSAFANTNSSTYYIYAFISSFLGQLLPFRDHRPMQKLILQLTIMLTFILGTLHQSIMIASITGSLYQSKITEIDQLIDGDYSFYVDQFFVAQLNGSEYYQRMSPKIIKFIDNKTQTTSFNYRNLSSENIVIVASCSSLDSAFDKSDNRFISTTGASGFYYKLEERFNIFFLKFLVAPRSFFYERLQEFSLKVFESGIRQHWDIMNPLKPEISSSELKNLQEADYFLNLVDIAPAFYILACGLLISFFFALIEMFYFFVHSKLREMKKRCRVLKCDMRIPPKVKQRIIEVRPINQI